MSHCFQFMVIHTKKQRDMSPCFFAISFKLVLTYNTKTILIPKPWRSGWLELLIFQTFLRPNQLCGGSIKVLWTFIAWALNYKSEGGIKLFELLISESWRTGWLELLMFATFVLPNQLCGGKTTKSNSSSYWFLNHGAVVDWNYSCFQHSYFLINCAGAKLRNQTLRVTDFWIMAQWLIGTTHVSNTRTS